MTDNATRWERVCPIQRNEFATDFHPVAATRSADVPRVMLPATSKEWAVSGRSTGPPSNCNYGAMHTVSVTFKRRWVMLLSLTWAVETEDNCFRYTCAVSVLVSKHFLRYWYRTDAGGIGRYRVPDASIGLTLVYTVDWFNANRFVHS